MKQNMFFSHSAVSIGLSVWRGFGSHLVCQNSFFFFAVHQCLSCPAHPPLMCFLGSSGCYCIIIVSVSCLPFLARLCCNTSDLWC